ncbi:MAG: hypothetical protein ACTTKI_10650 [Tannerella sp.]|uniref:hypothetical protein n=1 Tax=Tannerella sp. TaxID=2382127 RepID=UPI003FA2F18A
MNINLDAPLVIPNAVRNLARKRKEILRFALNDKRPNAEEHPPTPPSKGEERSEGGCYLFKGGMRKRSVGKTGERLGVRPWASGGEPTEQRARRKKIRLSEQSELPDFPTCKRREGVRSARSLDLLVTFGSSQK